MIGQAAGPQATTVGPIANRQGNVSVLRGRLIGLETRQLPAGESTEQKAYTESDRERGSRIASHCFLGLFSYVLRRVLRASDLRVCNAGDCGSQPFEVGTDGLELVSPLLPALVQFRPQGVIPNFNLLPHAILCIAISLLNFAFEFFTTAGNCG